jgi:hypothetical protein
VAAFRRAKPLQHQHGPRFCCYSQKPRCRQRYSLLLAAAAGVLPHPMIPCSSLPSRSCDRITFVITCALQSQALVAKLAAPSIQKNVSPVASFHVAQPVGRSVQTCARIEGSQWTRPLTDHLLLRRARRVIHVRFPAIPGRKRKEAESEGGQAVHLSTEARSNEDKTFISEEGRALAMMRLGASEISRNTHKNLRTILEEGDRAWIWLRGSPPEAFA